MYHTEAKPSPKGEYFTVLESSLGQYDLQEHVTRRGSKEDNNEHRHAKNVIHQPSVATSQYTTVESVQYKVALLEFSDGWRDLAVVFSL